MRDSNDLLFEVVLYNLNAANKKHSDIDLKALTIISICGLLIGIITGSSSSELKDEIHSNFILQVFFAISVASLLLTIMLCTNTILPQKGQEISTFLMYEYVENETEERQIKKILATCANNEEKLQIGCDRKAKQLLQAITAFSGSIFVVAVYEALIFFIF